MILVIILITIIIIIKQIGWFKYLLYWCSSDFNRQGSDVHSLKSWPSVYGLAPEPFDLKGTLIRDVVSTSILSQVIVLQLCIMLVTKALGLLNYPIS